MCDRRCAQSLCFRMTSRTGKRWTGARYKRRPRVANPAGDDGNKRCRGSKVHAAVDTLGHLLALVVTPANAQDRAQVAELAAAVQATTGETVAVASVDHGYTCQQPATDADTP